MEGPEGRTPEARGLQGSGPSPEATQGRLPTVSSQVSHCSRVPEQSLAVRARKPVMHQRIEPNQEWGYLSPPPPGRASVTPLSPRIHPRPDQGGHRWIGFPPVQPSRVPASGVPFFPSPCAPASRSPRGPALSQPGCGGVTIRTGTDRAAASLAALEIVEALVVRGALLCAVSSLLELGAHAGFLCSRT